MPRDFFNQTETEFDESKHISSREIWEGLAKHLVANFEDIVSKIVKDNTRELTGLENMEEARKLGLEMPEGFNAAESRQKIETIKKELEALKEYGILSLEEDAARIDRKKDPKFFLEKRKELIGAQEELIKMFKEDFINEALAEFKKLAAYGGKELKEAEDHFAILDGGILPYKPRPPKQQKEIHPEFIRTLNESLLGANVLNEGLAKLWKEEKEIIDERLHSKKEKPY